MTLIRCALASAILIACIPAEASAQYFGQNKVQYRTHEFHVLQTEHFDIYFHQSRQEPVEVAGRMAERWWRRLSTVFGFELSGRQPIVLYSSKPDFDQTSVVSGLIDGGTAGLTEPWRRRIALPFAASLADTDHVLGHEIVHAFQFDFLAGVSPSQGGSDAEPLALWAIEGLAEYLTLGPVEPHTAMWLRDAVRRRALPHVADLAKPEYFPYRWGHAFWAYVGGRWGDAATAQLFAVAALTGMRSAIETVLGITADQFSEQWHDALRAAYPPGTSVDVGTHIAGARPVGGSVNVGAAISPDGQWVAYLTERLFGVDLVVADARSGRVAATLTDTAADPHYSSLQYIGSAAAWGPQGRRLAISTLTSGRPALSIFAWPGGRLERDIVIDGVDEIFGPAWSPDGRAVAFTGMSQGATDLFVFDLERLSLRRLTDDLFADLQPVWSPDGRTLAFVSDRFTTDLETLTTGPLRLATIDVATSDIRPIDAFRTGKHISPQWSRDGRTLYFISDSGGGPDVYALDLADGALARLTEAESGVAGLTASSPALSIAADANAAVVSVYEAGVFAVHTLAITGGVPAASPDAAARSAIDAAPPVAESWQVSKYRPRLALENVAQGGFGAGVDAFGATVEGGLALTFTDMLRTHWLTGAVRISNPLGGGFSLRDVAGSGAYFNQTRRWHWGVAASAVPTYVGVRSAPAEGAGLDLPWPFVLVRQVERAVQGGVSYPFSRARRVELSGGLTALSFDELSGVFTAGAWMPAAAPMTLGHVGAAFVSDTSHTGPTSVVSGERYRLEISPVAGGLDYLNVSADYRRYVMPVPFYTIALRALHVGRYGRGADDTRIVPLYIGYPWLVRGFGPGWGDVNGCVTILSAGCGELDHLLGSRIAVGNVELRLPVLRPFGLSRSMYGPLPLEVAVFADGGVAWQSAPLPRRPVWSTGVTFRTNLLGFGLGQFDIVRPFGPDTRGGWTVRFNLAPAF